MDSPELQEQEVFSDADVLQWEKGSVKWNAFWKEATKGKWNSSPDDIIPLQALFLGEKPAVFWNKFAETNAVLLRKWGFETCDKYTYDPARVQAVLDRHQEDIAPKFQGLEAKAYMQLLSESDKKDNDRERGLILGFPLSAVKYFESQQHLGQLQLQVLQDLERAGYIEDRDHLNEVFYLARMTNATRKELGTRILLKHAALLSLQPDQLELLERSFEKRSMGARGSTFWINAGPMQDDERKVHGRLAAAFDYTGLRSPLINTIADRTTLGIDRLKRRIKRTMKGIGLRLAPRQA